MTGLRGFGIGGRGSGGRDPGLGPRVRVNLLTEGGIRSVRSRARWPIPRRGATHRGRRREAEANRNFGDYGSLYLKWSNSSARHSPTCSAVTLSGRVAPGNATQRVLCLGMPRGFTSGKAATYEDLLRVPDHLVAEIIDGELYATPRPALRHALAASSLGDELVSPFQKRRGGPGGWWILFEPELHLGPDIVVPDLAGWRRERLPEVPDEAFLTLAPDWLAEILSLSTATLDRAKKLAVYARERVAHVWLLDPISRILEVLALEQRRWVIQATHGAESRIRVVPFDAIGLDLQSVWAGQSSGER